MLTLQTDGPTTYKMCHKCLLKILSPGRPTKCQTDKYFRFKTKMFRYFCFPLFFPLKTIISSRAWIFFCIEVRSIH